MEKIKKKLLYKMKLSLYFVIEIVFNSIDYNSCILSLLIHTSLNYCAVLVLLIVLNC